MYVYVQWVDIVAQIWCFLVYLFMNWLFLHFGVVEFLHVISIQSSMRLHLFVQSFFMQLALSNSFKESIYFYILATFNLWIPCEISNMQELTFFCILGLLNSCMWFQFSHLCAFTCLFNLFMQLALSNSFKESIYFYILTTFILWIPCEVSNMLMRMWKEKKGTPGFLWNQPRTSNWHRECELTAFVSF